MDGPSGRWTTSRASKRKRSNKTIPRRNHTERGGGELLRPSFTFPRRKLSGGRIRKSQGLYLRCNRDVRCGLKLRPVGSLERQEQVVNIAEAVFAAIERDFHFLCDGQGAKHFANGLVEQGIGDRQQTHQEQVGFFRIHTNGAGEILAEKARVRAVRTSSGGLPALMATTAKTDTQRRNSSSPSKESAWRTLWISAPRPSKGEFR